MHPLTDLLHLLAPPRCLGCETPSAPPFCPPCDSLLERSPTPGSVFSYGGPIADAIHRFKYERRSELGSTLGQLLARAAEPLRGEVDAVVPVPLHWRRRRWRGFDQAALLAKPVAGFLGVPLVLRELRRVRHTANQVDLPRNQRRANLAGAFRCGRLHDVERALLVDDVKTTGATLDAASDALRNAGVREVRALVLATRVLS